MTFAWKNKNVASVLTGVALVAAAPSAWSMMFSDALRLAFEHDPEVASYLAQYDSDVERGRIERGSLYPTLTAKGRAYNATTESKATYLFDNPVTPESDPVETPQNVYDNYNSWRADLELRQPLFRLDWFDRLDRAAALDDQARIALRERKTDLVGKTSQRYLEVLQAIDQERAAEAEAKAVRESLGDTQKRYDVQLVPGTDLKEAKARDDLAQARLVAARRGVEIARDALDETTGDGYVEMPVLREDVPIPPLMPGTLEEWVKITQDNSPRLQTARREVEVKRAESEAQRAARYPTLDLVGAVMHDDTTEFAAGAEVDDQRIGVELTVPLYAGGVNSARARQAAADLRVAEATLNRTSRETEREARQLFREAQSSYTESAAYAQALVSARAAEGATAAGYDAGTRTITDVLDARSRAVQARRDLNNARFTLLMKLLRLKQVAGVLQESDLIALDSFLAYPVQDAPAK
ncbi:MAG TPA: TolC family outer membrane protein [Nevskiaceae bacterium]|nr:TolC family outer membrane protein [Nevskiaceae bacterium]